MSGDINVQTFSGKVNINNNLLVGNSHLFVDTQNNRVGLVTANPDAGLHVESNAYIRDDFRVGSGILMNVTPGQITAGSFVGDAFLLSNVQGDSGSWVNGVSSNVHLATIGDSVGIGVVDPQYKLDVAGDINITSGSTLRVGGTPAVFSNWTVSGGDISRSSGNVGIGTTSPGDKLELHATGVGDNIGMIVGNGDRKYRVGVRGDTDDNFTIQDDTVGSMRMVIDTSGNVGIGTTSPQTNLHIESSGNTGLDIYGGDTNNPYIFIGEHASSYSRKWGMKMNYYGDSNTEWFNMAVVDDNTEINALTFRRNGNVGIGTQSPGYPLDVQFTGDSGIRSKNSGSSHASVYIDSASGYSYLRFEQSSVAKFWLQSTPAGGLAFRPSGGGHVMDILNNGNVGIGTSSPGYKLDVNGASIFRETVNIHPPSSGGGQNLFTGYRTGDSYGRAQLVLSSGYSDIIIASSQANNQHGSNLSFAAYNPSNVGDYRKFVINQGNWGTRKQFLEFGYEDSSKTNPHEATNDADTVLTMDGINKRVGIGTRSPTSKLHVNGDIKVTGGQTYTTRPVAMVGKSNGRVYSPNIIIYNLAGYNDGNLYNTSNGRFTAPSGYAGYYLVTYTGLGGYQESAPNTRWTFNGYDSNWGAVHFNLGSAVGSRLGLSSQSIQYLNVGDYISHRVITGSIYGVASVHSTTVVMYLGNK